MFCFKIFSFRKTSHVTKNWQIILLKEFFNEIWPKVGENKHIYNFEIKFEKKKLLKNGDQNKFCHIAQ